MIDITDEHYKAVEDFKEKAEQYLNKETDPLRFKAFRVGMGVYEQRTAESYMVRTRIPGGVITLEQFKKISAIAKKYSGGRIHLTSRQDAQFHNVELKNVYPIMKELIDAGIITKGTGGNTVRNVECSPLSGVSFDEIFDVTPYVKEVTNYLIKDPTTMNMPRKYKIAFSNTVKDTGNATISDLGFIAKTADGKKGFEVYGGGGFGGNPKVALKLSDFIEAKDVIYYVQAMKNLFEKEGDRNNKHKARIRYIVARLGEEKFIQLFNEELKELKAENKLDLNIDDGKAEKNIIESVQIDKEFENRLFQEKRSGYFSVYIHPQSGNLSVENLDKVLNFVDKLAYAATIRLTNTQGFFVRGLKEADAKQLITITSDFSSKFNLFNSSTCAGASTCQLGLCLSQALLAAVKKEFENADDKVKAILPRAFISGCPNSCAQHEKGSLGLHGRAKRTDDGLLPAYSVSFGGKVGSGGARMGEVYGDVPAKKVPQYLLKLSQLIVNEGYEDFEQFLIEKSDEIKALTNEYSTFESFKENPDLYYDFGACEKFSIEGRGPGECSTGVFDVIKLDLSNTENAINKYKTSRASSDLYSAAVSAARTLLVLHGIDTNKDREIFEGFKTNFVQTGYVNKEINELFDTLIDYKLGDVKDITSKGADVQYLIAKVKAMYESLNGKLEVTLPKETDIEKNTQAEESNGFEIVDFRGVKCPLNFVKVKIELSKIKAGKKRGFYLDDGAPIENVPSSVEKEGHKIVSIDRNYEGYNLLVVEKK